MTKINKLAKRGLVTEETVYCAYVGADGRVSRIDFTGGWNGLTEHGNAQSDDRYVKVSVPVRVIQVHWGKVVAKEDLLKVLEAVKTALEN